MAPRARKSIVTSEELSVERLFQQALLLSPQGQSALYRMLKDRLAEPGATPDEADETIERQQEAIEAMERVAAALGLASGQAPTTTQFTTQARALGLDWTVSKVGRAFRTWANAQKFFEDRRMPETARQIRQRRRLATYGRSPLDILAFVALWLDTMPVDTSDQAYELWRQAFDRQHASDTASLPPNASHLRKTFPALSWHDLVAVAQDPDADPWALARQRVDEALAPSVNPLRVLTVPFAAALLGVARHRFEYALSDRTSGFPQAYAKLGRRHLFLADDVIAYRQEQRAPRRPEKSMRRLWGVQEVRQLIGLAGSSAHKAIRAQRHHLVPAPKGNVCGEAYYWVEREVRAWLRRHPERVRP